MLNIIRSYRTDSGQSKILSAEEFLEISENIINNEPGAVIIVDSISQLVTSGELINDINKQDRASGAMLMARFCKRTSNAIRVNDIVLIGIMHYIANTSGYGASKVSSGGNKIKYDLDIGLECKGIKRIYSGSNDSGDPIGQEVTWKTTSTAGNTPPGQVGTSIITYGTGIDELAEMVTLAIDFGLIQKSGAWMKMSYMEDKTGEKFDIKNYQCQGRLNMIDRLRNNERERVLLEEEIRNIFGLSKG
jgi:recombination protein RecA